MLPADGWVARRTEPQAGPAPPDPPTTDVDAVGRRYLTNWWKATGRAVAVLVVVALSARSTGLLDLQRLNEGLPALGRLLGRMWPPDFGEWREWLGPLGDTVAMSISGTALAVALSLPLGVLAARTTAPHPAAFAAARLVLNGLRAVPELIMGIIFVAAVGFGPLPGALALGLHSVGMVGKFFAEIIEQADPAPTEAAQAIGASRPQTLLRAVLPQVLPGLAGVVVYRWEYNFRASTVLGAVGAGGIGAELIQSLRILRYREVGALLVVILVAVTVIDAISGRLRKKLS